MYKIKVFRNFQDEELKEAWIRIQHENNTFPQMHYEWVEPWVRLKSFQNKIYVITAEAGGKIVGIAPFYIETKGFVKILRTVPVHFGDFYTLISDRSQEVVSQILKYVKKYEEWNVVHFYNVNNKNILHQSLLNEGFKSKEIVNIHAANFKGKDFNEFLLTLSKNTRGQYRKKWNRLVREGDVKFEAITDSNSYMNNVDTMNRLYNLRWAKDSTPLLSQEYYNMRNEAIAPCFDKGKAVMYKLSFNNQAIAYRLGFLNNGSFYDWKVVHDPEFNYYSPGNLMVGKIIDSIIENGYHEFNFMTGDYRYKRSWISKEHTTINSEYFNAKQLSFGSLYIAYRIKLREKIKQIYYKYKK